MLRTTYLYVYSYFLYVKRIINTEYAINTCVKFIICKSCFIKCILLYVLHMLNTCLTKAVII